MYPKKQRCFSFRSQLSHLTAAVRSNQKHLSRNAEGSRNPWVIPENAKGGGKTAGGGGAKPHDEKPHRKQFPTPPHLGTLPPPQCHFSYKVPYKLPEFPSGDPLGNSFRRVSKNGFRWAILPRFCPPPLFCPPLWLGPIIKFHRRLGC